MALVSVCHLKAIALVSCFLLQEHSVVGQNLLSCETNSADASGYRCNGTAQCKTFAILRTNPHLSSLSNLSFYLGISPSVIAKANGFPPETEFLRLDEPLLIPIDCKCFGGFFAAELTKTAVRGESFYGIAESLEGLTTCRAIREKNPSVSPWSLSDKVRLLIPLRCACPSADVRWEAQLLLSYPVTKGDTVPKLASSFNTTPEAIVAANNWTGDGTESLAPLTSLLIPLKSGPPLEAPSLLFPATSIPVHEKKREMWKLGLYVALGGMGLGAAVAVGVAFLLIQLKKKKNHDSLKPADVELQQLSLSVRTTSDKKVSFEGSQDPTDGQISDVTPRKTLVETYTIEDLRRATEGFSCGNHIEGSVFHGRLSGKNLAVKRIQPEILPDVNFELFQDAVHHHPNIMRLLGTCLGEGEEGSSFLVFEYARNGSLKDWLHGGLAMKNQFIASCYCFLTWNQRLKICLDVAMALHYMHCVMSPSYVHRNVKSRNIFLDEEFNAKMGNFGMERCADQQGAEDPEFFTTNPASWSLGYLAPEYVHQVVISPSIDIFAFGIVLLEVLSGKTPITRPNEKGEGSVWLSEKIKSILASENAEKLREWIDSALGENYSFEAAVAVANLGRACTEEDPSLRPSAGEVVEKLSRLVEELPHGDHIPVSESSCKPLVKAGANNC